MGARRRPTEPPHRRTRRGDHGDDLRRRLERRSGSPTPRGTSPAGGSRCPSKAASPADGSRRPDGWPEGLALGRELALGVIADRNGFAVHVSERGGPATEIFRHVDVIGFSGTDFHVEGFDGRRALRGRDLPASRRRRTATTSTGGWSCSTRGPGARSGSSPTVRVCPSRRTAGRRWRATSACSPRTSATTRRAR